MTGGDPSGEKPVNLKKSVQPGGRDARLAAALRENLRRRKVQEKVREKAREWASEQSGAAPDQPNATDAAGPGRQDDENP
jgi:hypothetical protein